MASHFLSIATKAAPSPTAGRPGLDELLKDCRRRAIDVVVVWKFDRFSRSLKNLIAGLELCRALGIDFVSITEAVDTSFRLAKCRLRTQFGNSIRRRVGL